MIFAIFALTKAERNSGRLWALCSVLVERTNDRSALLIKMDRKTRTDTHTRELSSFGRVFFLVFRTEQTNVGEIVATDFSFSLYSHRICRPDGNKIFMCSIINKYNMFGNFIFLPWSVSAIYVNVVPSLVRCILKLLLTNNALRPTKDSENIKL